MVGTSSGDSSHSDESAAQRPFAATSDSLANVARAQGIRLQDEEMAKKMHERWKANWDDVDNELDEVRKITGLSSSGRGSDPDSIWWLTSSPSSPSRMRDETTQAEKRSRKRVSPRNTLKPGTAKDDQMQYDAPPTLAQQLQAALVPGDDRRQDALLDHSSPIALPSLKNDAQTPPYGRPTPSDDTLALLLPLLILLSTLLFLLLIFIVLVIFVRRRARIALTEGDGPLDVGREEELEGLGGLAGVEERWLETVDDSIRRGFARAKEWSLSFPPGSQSTDITLSQFLTIQEKGVSAWSFDPDYESNPSVYVEARTEITFVADGEGMAPQEGGGCCVQSNLPLPKVNEVYYWEAKMFTKPANTNVAIGLASKPYPSFRLPGWSKFSVGFFSADGFKSHNYPFTSQSYGPAYLQGDVIGVGYRPRSGTVFFTRNGKKLEDAFIGLNRQNLFPTIGADGAAEVHINLGQAGFVFIEANVKKWGLAPMVGTLAPPPPYGMERGSILIESGQGTSNDQEGERESAVRSPLRDWNSPPPPPSTSALFSINPPASSSPLSSLSTRRRARRSARIALGDGTTSTSSDPAHEELPSSSLIPNRLSLLEEGTSGSSSSSQRRISPRSDSFSSNDAPHNPPTPNHLDISLHSLENGNGDSASSPLTSPSTTMRRAGGRGGVASYFPRVLTSRGDQTRSPSPPAYLDQRHSWASTGSLGGTEASGNQARRASGRSHALANALFGALADRGLLTPLSAQDNSLQETSRPLTLPRHESVLDYERLQGSNNTLSNTQANSSSSANTWLSWLRG
ncbi:hypothetical protein CBS101457_003628 [Exobasidium rhododendri]|nr:hypothetical protein CBS101457_003628 [Exobasidium rhododendri]